MSDKDDKKGFMQTMFEKGPEKVLEAVGSKDDAPPPTCIPALDTALKDPAAKKAIADTVAFAGLGGAYVGAYGGAVVGGVVGVTAMGLLWALWPKKKS